MFGNDFWAGITALAMVMLGLRAFMSSYLADLATRYALLGYVTAIPLDLAIPGFFISLFVLFVMIKNR